ncbi:rCG38433 [Rattus norvegicus]|uniref:RCG38433 n=1 Tax=Rattus norvegicus TaxID=10116 RepID=A6KMD9_RAT|nr:rCG38433 [Rattus norvegicus]
MNPCGGGVVGVGFHIQTTETGLPSLLSASQLWPLRPGTAAAVCWQGEGHLRCHLPPPVP